MRVNVYVHKASGEVAFAIGDYLSNSSAWEFKGEAAIVVYDITCELLPTKWAFRSGDLKF